MIPEKKRYEAKQEIRQAVLNRLKEAAETGGRLEEVDSVVDRDRVRGVPHLPGIFLVREDERITKQSIGENVDYTLSLLVLVTHDQPDEGLDLAERLRDEAVTVVCQGRLGLDYVSEVTPIEGMSPSPGQEDGRRIGSIGVIKVSYQIIPV